MTLPPQPISQNSNTISGGVEEDDVGAFVVQAIKKIKDSKEKKELLIQKQLEELKNTLISIQEQNKFLKKQLEEKRKS